MGELKVHRVRFFDYMPSAIRAMAFNPRTERLAVARGDGAVEVFNFADHYFQEKVGGWRLEAKDALTADLVRLTSDPLPRSSRVVRAGPQTPCVGWASVSSALV